MANPIFPLILSFPCINACCGVNFLLRIFTKISRDVRTTKSGFVPIVAGDLDISKVIDLVVASSSSLLWRWNSTMALNLDFNEGVVSTAAFMADKMSSVVRVLVVLVVILSISRRSKQIHSGLGDEMEMTSILCWVLGSWLLS